MFDPTALKVQAAKAGLNANGLAKAAGINPSTISDWMRGKHNPGLKSLERLAKALGCQASQLLKEQP